MTKEEQKGNENFDFIIEERLHEILSILLPYGYSHCGENRYTGVSPYIEDRRNIITVVSNDRDVPLSIFMEKLDDECDEKDMFGFYVGIMKIIAPSLIPKDEEFNLTMDILDFCWISDKYGDDYNNDFPAKVTYEPF